MDSAPQIIREAISLATVQELAQRGFGDMVKASVDIGRGIMAIGRELHSDEEALLLEDGARQALIHRGLRRPSHSSPCCSPTPIAIACRASTISFDPMAESSSFTS